MYFQLFFLCLLILMWLLLLLFFFCINFKLLPLNIYYYRVSEHVVTMFHLLRTDRVLHHFNQWNNVKCSQNLPIKWHSRRKQRDTILERARECGWKWHSKWTPLLLSIHIVYVAWSGALSVFCWKKSMKYFINDNAWSTIYAIPYTVSSIPELTGL